MPNQRKDSVSYNPALELFHNLIRNPKNTLLIAIVVLAACQPSGPAPEGNGSGAAKSTIAAPAPCELEVVGDPSPETDTIVMYEVCGYAQFTVDGVTVTMVDNFLTTNNPSVRVEPGDQGASVYFFIDTDRNKIYLFEILHITNADGTERRVVVEYSGKPIKPLVGLLRK